MRKQTNHWIDFFFLEVIGILLLMQRGFEPYMVVFLLASILPAGPALLLEKPWNQLLGSLPLLLSSFVWPPLMVFLPASVRLAFREELQLYWGVILLGVPLLQETYSLPERLLVVCLIGFALLLAWREKKQREVTEDLLQLKDDSWEKQELLKQKNQELIHSQETFIDLEISEERNRIARDIHDNVGHLLSSAIIQLGAIEAINQSDSLKKPLHQLKTTVHTGMDNLRESVHDLHETSLSFEKGLDLLLADFQFCDVAFDGTIPDSLTPEQERTLLMVLKEALANVMKHSNATKVTLSLTELPAFYQLQIADNGTIRKKKGSGIGLKSMRQRVEHINGQLHLSQNPTHFLIHVVLPKKDSDTIRHPR